MTFKQKNFIPTANSTTTLLQALEIDQWRQIENLKCFDKLHQRTYIHTRMYISKCGWSICSYGFLCWRIVVDVLICRRTATSINVMRPWMGGAGLRVHTVNWQKAHLWRGGGPLFAVTKYYHNNQG